MKKFLLALGFTALLASPALAHGWDPDARRGHHPQYHHHRHDRDPRPEYRGNVSPGVFFGLSISPSYRYYEPSPYRNRSPRLWCETIETRDSFGYLEDRRTVCHNR